MYSSEDQENRPASRYPYGPQNFGPGLSKSASDFENDQHSASLIRELLNSDNDWANVPEIVKMTLKVFYNVLNSQATTIGGIEEALPLKANKQEVNSALNSKANVKDIKNTFGEFAQNIENRATMDDVQKIVGAKLTGTQPFAIPQSNENFGDFRAVGDTKLSTQEVSTQMESFKLQMSEFYQEISSKVGDLENSVHTTLQELEDRPTTSKINELLNTKANKPTVAQALHRKANRGEIDELLSQKADIGDLHKIVNQLNSKVEIADFQHLQSLVETKMDRGEYHDLASFKERFNETADKQVFDVLSKDREIYNSRLENLEIEVKTALSNFDREMNDISGKLSGEIAKKADYRDIDAINSALINKADLEIVSNMLSDAKSQLLNKWKNSKEEIAHSNRELGEDIYERYNKLSKKLDKCINDIKSIKENNRDFSAETHRLRNDVKDMMFKEMELITSQIKDEISNSMEDWYATRIKFENELSQRARKTDLIELKNDFINRLEPKVELSEVQSALNSLQSEIANRLVTTKVDLQNNLSSAQEQINHQLAKKCGIQEFNEALSAKIDSSHFRAALDAKANKGDHDAIRGGLDRMVRDLEGKASIRELDSHVAFTKSSIEDMAKELIQKAQAKDLSTLFEEKASRHELDKAFQALHGDLSDKVPVAELKTHLEEQKLVNEALCSENCIGRWIWKSGEAKSSGLIPWEVQCANTCPDNFVWEKNKSSIICVAPGLYELGVGFYSKSDPNIQVQVNGEPVLTLFKDSNVE